MSTITSFEIKNCTTKEMEIIHEPEAFIYNLPIKEEVIIETGSVPQSIALWIYVENNKICIQIMGHNSHYKVIHNGEDAFPFL